MAPNGTSRVTPASDPLHEPRICVSFLASPRVPKDRLASWPQVWARGPTDWEELELTPQTRRLACLLALRPAGYSAGEVGRALGGGVQSKGAAQNAAGRLGDALEQVGLRALFVRSAKGGRGAKPWALREATTDVELAAAAVAEERWTDAAHLTRGGTAELVGIPCPVVTGDWRELPPLAARSLPPTSKGALPFELYDSAEHSKRRVRAHRTDWQPAATTTPQAAGPLQASRPRCGGLRCMRASPIPRPPSPRGTRACRICSSSRMARSRCCSSRTRGSRGTRSRSPPLPPPASSPGAGLACSDGQPRPRGARDRRSGNAGARRATAARSDPVVLTIDNLVARA